jgi:hypothetical protein
VALFKLTIIKSFQYRGAVEEFSNSYVISGTAPTTAGEWTAWGEKLKDVERPVLPFVVTFVEWYGYSPGSWETKPSHIDAHGTYAAATNGSLTVSGGSPAPGDAAVWVRWDTGQYTSRGKKIYLRKYFHGAYSGGATADTVLPAQVTALAAYGAKMYDGASLIGTARMARHTGTLPIAHSVGPFITTRTLKRRGKRNPTP